MLRNSKSLLQVHPELAMSDKTCKIYVALSCFHLHARAPQPEAVSSDVLPYLQSNPDEEDVGMTAYISPGQLGFTGVLKQRYSDFIVHEIDLSGNICTLQDAPGFLTLPSDVTAEVAHDTPLSSADSADTVATTSKATTSKATTEQTVDSTAECVSAVPIEAPVLTELEIESAGIVKGVTALREVLGNETADTLQQFLLAVVTEEHSTADDKRNAAINRAQQQQRSTVSVGVNTDSNDGNSTSTTSSDSVKRKADVLVDDTESAVDTTSTTAAATAQEMMPVNKKAKIDSGVDINVAAVSKSTAVAAATEGDTALLSLKNAAGRYVHLLPLEVATNKQDRGKVSLSTIIQINCNI
jgi:hypothetical protein